MRRRLTVALAVAIFAGIALVWAIGSLATRGHAIAVPAAVALARDLSLRSRDGVVLAATFRPGTGPRAPAVLLLHGVGGSRAAVAPMAAWLARRGYGVLTLDFRGHGGSTITSRSFGWDEAADARAGFDWLRAHQRGARIAVIGISMGGAAALLGRDGPLPADAIVLQAVYPDIRHAIRNRLVPKLGKVLGAIGEPLLSLQARPRFGIWPGEISPLRAMARVKAPVLVIGGGEDRYTPPEETRDLYAAAPRQRRMLWIAPGADHAATSALDGADYHRVVEGFLRRTIG